MSETQRPRPKMTIKYLESRNAYDLAIEALKLARGEYDEYKSQR